MDKNPSASNEYGTILYQNAGFFINARPVHVFSGEWIFLDNST